MFTIRQAHTYVIYSALKIATLTDLLASVLTDHAAFLTVK